MGRHSSSSPKQQFSHIKSKRSFPARSSNRLVVPRAHTLQVRSDLAPISANYHRSQRCRHSLKFSAKSRRKSHTMLRIPAIRSAIVVWERRLQALERHIGTAHQSLAQVVEAVNHVPVMVVRHLVAGCHGRVCRRHDELEGAFVSWVYW